MRMKGTIMVWGILGAIILISAVTLLYLLTTKSVVVTVIDNSANIIKISDLAAATSSAAEASIEYVAERQAYENLQNSGLRFPRVWTLAEPSEALATDELRRGIIESFPRETVDMGNKKLKFGTLELNQPKPCADKSCFLISASLPVTASDSKETITNKLDNAYIITVNSNFYQVFDAGRRLFEGEYWTGTASVSNSILQVSDKCRVNGTDIAVSSEATAKIQDMLNFSQYCGFSNKPGISSLSDPTREKAIPLLSEVNKAIAQKLKEKYGYEYTITSSVEDAVVGANRNLYVKTSVSIKDPKSYAPALSTEKGTVAEGKGVAAVNMELKFEARSDFTFPKG
ncbi:MAG: hypothetical protein HY362_03700 [Candidatus Aenigmarchaeota archaeon]|nr:hypothetical protein [Candidatus Aenigmarchaeota archaeon]